MTILRIWQNDLVTKLTAPNNQNLNIATCNKHGNYPEPKRRRLLKFVLA